MRGDHFNEPRDVGYDKENLPIYSDKKTSWISKDSTSIFSGVTQAQLFLFAMSIGKNRPNKKEMKKIEKNIPTSVFKEEHKWLILSSVLSKEKNLLLLKNEKDIYSTAEEYANEGIEILKSHMDKYGPNYPKMLEVELREILKK